MTALVSSTLTLTLLACDRFFGVVFVFKSRLTERRSSVFIVLVWAVAVLSASPLLAFRSQYHRQWSDHLEVHLITVLSLSLSLSLFVSFCMSNLNTTYSVMSTDVYRDTFVLPGVLCRQLAYH